MKLLIQLFVIAALILTSASIVTAENVIRYLYSDGNSQTGLECTLSDIKKIATIFDALNTPSNLRKRSVEQPERELQSKPDTIHRINFDDAGFSADDTASYHLPSCDDKCNGYHPDKCFASNIKDKKGYRHRDLQLASANFTKVVVGEISNAIYPANCKTLCAGQVSGMCKGVPGCQGYRRELTGGQQEERDFDKGRDLQLASANFTKVVVGDVSNAIYPANCKTLCAGQVSGMCKGVPGCQGYRRELTGGKQEERDLTLLNTTSAKENKIYPTYCRDRCVYYPVGHCLEPGCVGYRRRRQLTTDPMDWCAKASQVIDQKLKNVLRELSPQCRVLIHAPRRKECYDDAVICGAK